jgi:hypothetical protein
MDDFFERTMIVKIDKAVSDTRKLQLGVSQGSILNPLLFTVGDPIDPQYLTVAYRTVAYRTVAYCPLLFSIRTFFTLPVSLRIFLINSVKLRFLMLKSRKTVLVLVRDGSRFYEKLAFKRPNGNI